MRRDILCALPSPAQRGHVALRGCSVVAKITGETDGQQILRTQYTCVSRGEERAKEWRQKERAARSRRTISAGRDSTMERGTHFRRHEGFSFVSVMYGFAVRNREIVDVRQRRCYEMTTDDAGNAAFLPDNTDTHANHVRTRPLSARN